MPNSIAGNPWELDTEGEVYTHPVKIKTIIWELPEAEDDDLLIHDKHGRVVLQAKAEAASQTQIFRLGAWYEGITLSTIDSGVVRVHIY